MTCNYSDLNQHDALYKTARSYPGGVEALAQRMGVSAPVLYNKLRPSINTHHTSFEQVSEIIEFSTEANVPDALLALHAFNWRHGLVAFSIPTADERDEASLIEFVCKSVQEFGHMTTAVTGAMADGQICARELTDINQEFQHLFAALAQLQELIAQKAKKQQVQGAAYE